MKNIHSLFSLLLLVNILSSSSCHRRDQLTIPLDKDFLSYINFNTGSWWKFKKANGDTIIYSVYENSGIYKISQDNEDYHPKHTDVYYEGLWLRTTFGYDSIYHEFRTYVLNDDPGNMLNLETTFFPINGIIDGDSGFNFFKYKDGTDTLTFRANPNETAYIKEVDDSLVVGTKTYHTTITIAHDGVMATNIFKEITYSKNIGTVRFKMWDGTVWNLIDYHLN